MRSKTILSTAVFIVAFVFSTAFANLFVDKNVSVSQPLISESNWRTRQQIRNFLEQDRQYSYELTSDLMRLVHQNEITREETATFILVRKMRRMDDSALPLDFRTAWENHVRAWEDQADFLHRSNRNLEHETIDEESSEDYGGQSGEINRTYYALIEVAQQHGVDFPY